MKALMLGSIAQNSNPPWWGISVLAGAFTILGAMLSQTVTVFLARSQAKRDDASRWHVDRLKSYTSLLRSIDNVYYHLLDDYVAPIEPEDVFDAVEPDATTARLLAGPEVDRAISKILGDLATVADRGWGSDSLSTEELQKRLVRLRMLMRADLGVPLRDDETS